jgi:hypothetical protein
MNTPVNFVGDISETNVPAGAYTNNDSLREVSPSPFVYIGESRGDFNNKRHVLHCRTNPESKNKIYVAIRAKRFQYTDFKE